VLPWCGPDSAASCGYYLLGGKDNYTADRKAGDALVDAYPTMVDLARANRAFLGRAGTQNPYVQPRVPRQPGLE
jgi:hypothetical protein